MNSVKLLHIKCCFFQFFNSPVALKNEKNSAPQEKVEMTPLAGSGGKARAASDFCVFQIQMELSKQLKSATLFCFTSIIRVTTLLKLVFHSVSDFGDGILRGAND